ncbi:pecanex-like protein 4 isoform X2 [Biomphalaria pfeifferi]|uniref:Pecanex-like protein n=1 Tax=Biomphalaria pfeifferi TaxID=112525 RepID=A0AAD8B8Y9_BIOPF|nr:pecanex-like protein 4 isoform X2 [Biomphalaria pfeifferi]
MGMGVPLLNEYKRSFLYKRIPQTLLGGLKVKVGYDAPHFVYTNQIALWLVPLLLGWIFTLVLELAYSDDELQDFLLLYSCLYGACIIIFVVVVQTITTVVDMKEKENTHALKLHKNILADEDEIEFQSCCGAETLAFIIPPKKFKVNIALHALLSGAVCGLGFWFLLPTTINHLYYYNYGATATIFIFGWLTVSITQYSLTTSAPPEPAVYRTMDTYEMLPLTRPIYALICYSIHIANWYYEELVVANQVLHVVFVLLPLIWFSGLLPPVEVLILWLLEQFHVFMLGGSPSASTTRLIMMVALSIGSLLGCYFMSSCFSSVVFAALTGYLLSCSLGLLGTQILTACTKSNNNRVSSTGKATLSSAVSSPLNLNGFLWTWSWCTALYHLLMLCIVAIAAGLTNYHVSEISPDVIDIIGYAIIGLCVAEKVLRDVQCVFPVFGLWRNTLFPHNSEHANRFKIVKKRLLVFGIMHRSIVTWVSPILMVIYMSLQIKNSDVMDKSIIYGMSTSIGVLFVFSTIRTFRWIWQKTTHALLEVSVIHIILVTLPDNSIVQTLRAPILLLITCAVRDRLTQISNKLFYVLALIVSSWNNKKQRRRSTACIMMLNFFFFPVVLVVVLAASVLSAPLLCLFTLPLFFIGFPRPNKFWPEPVGSSASTCPDSVYYRQITVELAKALSSAFANGSLGEPDVGNHYLMRFQDRLIWAMILERGSGFCTVNIKGLELQETSCHTAEAARVDDQFTEAFVGKNGGFGICSFNKYPMHCMTPVDTAIIKAYSDARNVLTGVIDSPDSVGISLSFFAKSLVWVLLHHINKLKHKEEMAKKLKEKEIEIMERANKKNSGELHNSGPYRETSATNKRKDKVSVVNNNTAPKELNHNVIATANQKQDLVLHHKGGGDSFALPPYSKSKANQSISRPVSGGSNSSRRISLSSSLHSFTDSIWSDDFDLDKTKKKSASTKQLNKVSTVVSITNSAINKPPSPHPVLTMLPQVSKKTAHVAESDFMEDLNFGLPAVDVNIARTRPNIDFDDKTWTLDTTSTGGKFLYPSKSNSKFMVSNGNHIYKPLMNLAGSPDFKCQYSTHISVPVKWRELPIEPSQLARYIASFPTSWYKHVLNTLDWSVTEQSGQKVASEVASDDALTNCYSQLVMACYSAFDTPGRPGGANYLYKCYNGDVPWNAMMDWVAEDRELHKLVIKSFRYGFKLMLDQILLGDITEDEELESYLQSYDEDWYIGKDTDPEWSSSVIDNKGNLFSLGHNAGQGIYTSRTLSLQEVMVHMGRVNRESVTGQWSNLNLELLYMTNDDEERYSIQAQPAMLRNLTVQAADPPLGYPIYSSPPISIPTV